MQQAKQATGTDLIINKDFWFSLPGFVKVHNDAVFNDVIMTVMCRRASASRGPRSRATITRSCSAAAAFDDDSSDIPTSHHTCKLHPDAGSRSNGTFAKHPFAWVVVAQAFRRAHTGQTHATSLSGCTCVVPLGCARCGDTLHDGGGRPERQVCRG